MAKKKIKKSRSTRQDNPLKTVKAQELYSSSEEDTQMDFGGLPNRDLKKNLGGCG